MTELEIDKLAQENIQNLVDHLLNLTCRLIILSEDKKKVEGHCSGFLLKIEDKYFLISAGHCFEECTEWLLETNVSIKEEHLTVLIPIKNYFRLKRIDFQNKVAGSKWIDFAWAEIDLDCFSKSIKNDTKLKGKKFEFPFYKYSLNQKPILEKIPYSYASWNRCSLLRTCRGNFRQMEASYEILMVFKGIEPTSGNYIFSLARDHQGHDYYSGASGSPIVNPEGKVISILLEGNKEKHELYGAPLADFVKIMNISS